MSDKLSEIGSLAMLEKSIAKKIAMLKARQTFLTNEIAYEEQALARVTNHMDRLKGEVQDELIAKGKPVRE